MRFSCEHCEVLASLSGIFDPSYVFFFARNEAYKGG